MKYTEYQPGLKVQKIRTTPPAANYKSRVGTTIGDFWLKGSHYYCNVDYGNHTVAECLNRLEIAECPQIAHPTTGEMDFPSTISQQKLPA